MAAAASIAPVPPESPTEEVKVSPYRVPHVEFREYVLYPDSRTETRRVIQGFPPGGHQNVTLSEVPAGIRFKCDGIDGIWPWSVIRGAVNVPIAKVGK